MCVCATPSPTNTLAHLAGGLRHPWKAAAAEAAAQPKPKAKPSANTKAKPNPNRTELKPRADFLWRRHIFAFTITSRGTESGEKERSRGAEGAGAVARAYPGAHY